MSLGVFLLVTVLLYFSILLLIPKIDQMVTNFINKQAHPSSLLSTLQKIVSFLNLDSVRIYSGYTALLLALWNFFAPDFGSISGGITLLGALIPSVMLFIDAFILTPSLLNWIPNEPFKEKLVLWLDKIAPIAGWLTLVVTILHAILYPLVFF